MQLSWDYSNTPIYTSIFMGENVHAQLATLLSQKPVGYIHSIFENGINIAFGKKLIFVGTTKNGMLPYGIHMRQEQVRRLRFYVKQNQTVIAQSADLIHFDHPDYPMTIDLSMASRFQYTIDSSQYLNYHDLINDDAMDHLHFIKKERTGLGATWEEFFRDTDEIRLELSIETTIRNKNELMQILLSEANIDKQKLDRLLRYFLGRGQGLTPSGDDYIVGLLAVHTLTQAFHPAFVSTLRQLIETEELTTDVSKSYLLHALEGRFSDKITHVIHALTLKDTLLFQAKLIRLLQTGHSSGIDTALGIIHALITIRRNHHVKTRCNCLGGERHPTTSPRSNI
ncbi:DUF2877 domain-containing protein [Paenibacillus sp. N1-5-1-14]|nr:DUF2877 domain-containing protein [Paenibacillus radicibacter]